MNVKKRYIFGILALCCTHGYAAIVLRGDSEDPTQTFTFPVKEFVKKNDGSTVIAARTIGGKEFALSRVQLESNYCMPLTLETTNINDTQGAANPLYNMAIRHLAISSHNNTLSVVPDAAPQRIFAVNDIVRPEKIILLGIPDVRDATGVAITNNIRTIKNGYVSVARESEFQETFVFAAVTNNAGDPFGTPGSGIALLERSNRVLDATAVPRVATPVFFQRDAEPTGVSTPDDPRAASLTGALEALYINTPVTLGDMVALHWDQSLRMLYVALQTTSGGDADDGARALSVAYISTAGKIIFKKIAPDDAFVAGTNNIVGLRDANEIITLNQVNTMHTSTLLSYAIVLGGYGDEQATDRTVYALPIVNDLSSDTHGQLAKKDALPVDTYYTAEPHRLTSRGFKDAATTNADLFVENDNAVRVGGGPLVNGPITQMYTQRDAVVAVVANADANYTSGIFYSRALFDKYGRVKGWTNWTRMTGYIQDQIFGSSSNPLTSGILTFVGADEENIRTIKSTIWALGDDNGIKPIVSLLRETFLKEDGGIRGFNNFSQRTPGLNEISLVSTTGNNKISLVQTGYTNAGAFTPIVGAAAALDPQTFDNGTITVDFPSGNTNAIIIKGGALTDLGSIVTSSIATTETNGYVAVGGVGGIALLMNNDGTGWPLPQGLGNRFDGLQNGMSFKKVGNYSFVRKIVCDSNFMYVLTDKTLDRVDLNASNLVEGSLHITNLATTNTLANADGFLDCIVSGPFAVLATSKGLFRTGEQIDVRIQQVTRSDWKRVAMPEGTCCAKQLYGISYSGRDRNITTHPYGMIYVLSADQGNKRACVFRFSVDISEAGVTMNQLPDLFVENIPSYLIEFDGYRNWFTDDGAYFYNEHDGEPCLNPMLYLTPVVQSGAYFAGNKNIPILAVHDGNHIETITQSNGSGTNVLPGDMGIIGNE